MSKLDYKTPAYKLKEIKESIRADDIRINPDAEADARNDFGWDTDDIKRCLLKLSHKKHFHKKDEHRMFPGTMMDYYKAPNIMEGQDVYTHFYKHPKTKKLTINSFHRLVI